MLTTEQLKAMPPHTTFATGIALDDEYGLFMNGTKRALRWVPVRGYYHDWAIYCHFAGNRKPLASVNLVNSAEYIRECGDKVPKEYVEKLVSCTREAMKNYRS